MERMKLFEEQLSEALDPTPTLLCYNYSAYGYPVHIICGTYTNGELQENWEHLNNAIAITLQAKLQNLAERYNIYLIIFEPGISTDLRSRIENNRYCCRKIVMLDSMPEKEACLQAMLENRLFRFQEQAEPTAPLQSVEGLLRSADPSGHLLCLVSNLKGHVSDDEAQRATDILQWESDNE